MKLIILSLSIAAMLTLASCEHLAGVSIGACYDKACVSVTLPQKPIKPVTDSGK